MKFLILILLALRTFAAINVTNYSFTYSSSIDAGVSNLVVWVAYDKNATGPLPMVGLCHPYSTPGDPGAFAFNTNNLTTLASNGWFIFACGMRGRDGASGTNDDNGREVYDIVDGLAAVTNAIANLALTNRTVLGYSGGGQNVLGLLFHFPDLFNQYADYFGITDPAQWYTESPGVQTYMNANIGGAPASVPAAYLARNSTNAVPVNLQQGHLWIFHNDNDTTVVVTQSVRLDAALIAAGNSRYDYFHDPVLYDHKIPNGTSPDPWKPDGLYRFSNAIAQATYPLTSLPSSGTLKVNGYLESPSRGLKIWLGGGTNEVADVTYNTATRSYTVTPLTGAMSVAITQGDCASTNTISSPVTIVLCEPGRPSMAGGAAINRGGRIR